MTEVTYLLLHRFQLSDNFFAIIIITAAIVYYSFFINTVHGHPSFWKGGRWFLFSSWHGSSSHRGTKQARLKSIVRKPSKERVIERIEEFILHEAFSFLTADQMLTISCLSRRFRDMTQQKKVWQDMAKRYFQITPSLSLVNKRAFFTYLKQYPLILAKSHINLFVIEGKVYELPAQFMSGTSVYSGTLYIDFS